MDIPVVGTVYDSSNNICADNIDLESRLQSSREIPVSIMWIISFWTAFCRKDTYGGSR